MKVIFAGGAVPSGEIARITGGTLFGNEKVLIKGICTDSKEAEEGLLFWALQGEKTHGCLYAEDAISGGCAAILSDRMQNSEKDPASIILVRDSLEALLHFAKTYRLTSFAHVVAITGSVGKTTTKETVARVLQRKFSTFRSSENHNSLVGAPLSLLELPKTAEWAVVELGMNHATEISRLSRCTLPEIAVITNVGTAHIGNLGSRENIALAKAEILDGLDPNGKLILPADEPLLENAGKGKNVLKFSLSDPNAEAFAERIRETPNGTLFDLHLHGKIWKDVNFHLPGTHLLPSILISALIGEIAGMSEEEMREEIESKTFGAVRQKILQFWKITVINDCYNASPESVSAALKVLSKTAKERGGRSVCFLGEMLELGKERETLHRAVGNNVAREGIDILLTLGEAGTFYADGAREAGMPDNRIFSFAKADFSEIALFLREFLRENDVLLLKASHAVGMEKILKRLEKIL